MRARTKEHDRVPSVNLLSQWVLDGLESRRLRHRFEAAALVLCLLAFAGWSLLHVRVGDAEQLLAVEEATSTQLGAESAALTEVRTYVTSVEQRTALVGETMGSEVQFSGVLADLDRITPRGVDLDSATITLTPAPVAGEAAADAAAVAQTEISPCPGPDPFHTRTVVGCITLSGTADSRGSVGEFVIRLGVGSRFVEPFVSTTTTADGQEVVFSGSVGLSEQVFSKRYADMDRFLSEGGRS